MDNNFQTIQEGKASIKTGGNVFYNPVQEFNRDLSISVLNVFAKQKYLEKANKKPNPEDIDFPEPGIPCPDGINILEALSATGLRSIRYAKEISCVKNIIANDLSKKAVDDITTNITDNKVEDLVTPSLNDATMIMYEHRKNDKFDAIDLDPYGCPSIFLDGAVQALTDGGLLLVTATDMAVLAGNSPQTCYSKYGAISLRLKSCHEMALRILLQCIESHANRYGKYIVPLLSISADFYVRVFVRVYYGPNKCKYTLSKLSSVFHCTGCDSYVLYPLGYDKINEKTNHVKFCLPTTKVLDKCEHCNHPYHVGGPIWSAPIHDTDFVSQVLDNASTSLTTYRRIEGVLSMVLEELPLAPLYHTLDRLAATLHAQTPSMLILRSALLHAGYEVSYTHAHKLGVKTNAPVQILWDIMRAWIKKHPVNDKRLIDGTPVKEILAKEPKQEYKFELHPSANPKSRQTGCVRFQENPLPHWGPGTRATAMVGDDTQSKKKRNQGKRKRELSQESVEVTS